MSILEDLYFGNIQPSEMAIKEGTEYQKIEQELGAMESAIRAELSTEGMRTFDAYINRHLALTEIEDCDSFIKGYRLGVKLLLAALLEYDTPLPQIANG